MEDRMSELNKFRVEKDDFFANHPHSPLTRAQKSEFRGLDYFPEASELRLQINVEQLHDQQEIQIQTSTGDSQTYQRYGKLHFQVDDQDVELTLFSNHHGFFLPFVDSLAGTETYPAGRYLEPVPLQDGRLLVDFNLAYNPYCAYNDAWSCPLTPFENRLRVPIRAGEKMFPLKSKQAGSG
jgi:uncharacterized protein (DUF1684 family)